MAAKIPTSINIDRDLRDQATEIFNELGISFSQAVTIFCRATVRENGLPFDMTIRRPKRHRDEYEDDDE
ncbi:type II toxin-antitoxin system RelB/DinJ family antitoxin [Bifidobacterium callitrichidarum]|uniref:Type II toxin-antitoxin system antitoxin, RelB/DinJ family n=1 Tax=Bifidobacterium callitrichidarum TaxID=2052941 RepID=A0A2U2NC27_9BIFI|nr:type II toxin-antitoxin system RelB/DinJ family antitoxin [Bifidobacterium callitrichidarum]PWG66701.1 type II toxin-antitoxin system antitoxin, RelB/DinJ family [Bifidobacterium callitrichidarum]